MFKPIRSREAQAIADALQVSENLFNKGRYRELEIVCQQIRKVNPNCDKALQFLGLAKYQQRKYEEALCLFQDLIDEFPDRAENYNNLALCHSCLGEFDAAISNLQAADELDPNNPLYLNNIGFQYRRKKEPKKAIPFFEHSLKVKPDQSYVYANMAGAYGEMNEITTAIFYLEEAVEVDPENNSAKVDLAYSCFLDGQWERAWEVYESRHNYYPHVKKLELKYNPTTRWRGEPIKGKTLVLYCEQGIGDLIQFLRYVPIVEKQFEPKLWIDAPSELHSIINKMGYVGFSGSVDHDKHCSIISLPYILNMTTEESVPNEPYIESPKNVGLPGKGKFNVGIVWAGNPQHPKDAARSCYLREFRVLETIEGIELFSLQKDLRKRVWPPANQTVDLTDGTKSMRLNNTGMFVKDFGDTADLIEALDLVITVDTAVLHLAGAIGQMAWGLIPFNPDWRWKTSGSTTVWYPSIKLYRQKERDNWENVFEEIVTDLSYVLRSRRNSI